MSNYTVNITGVNTSYIKVLSNEEMNNLFIKLKEGDKSVKDKLILGNLKLVLSILKKINKDKYNQDDLFQIGCIGLIKAIDNFDISYNCLFSTYAVPLILGEIKRYIRDNTTLRISRSIKDNAYHILKYKEEYLSIYGKYPSIKEIKDNLNLTEYDISLSLDSLYEPLSIYKPILNDTTDTIYLYDEIKDIKELPSKKEDLLSLKEALSKLKEREYEVIKDRYIIGKTQSEIAKNLNISQAQVSRIETNAIRKLKKILK